MVFTTLHSWRCQKWSYDRCKQAWIWPCYLPGQCSTVASIWSTTYVVDIALFNFTKDTYSMNIRMFLDYCDWTKKFEQYLHLWIVSMTYIQLTCTGPVPAGLDFQAALRVERTKERQRQIEQFRRRRLSDSHVCKGHTVQSEVTYSNTLQPRDVCITEIFG